MIKYDENMSSLKEQIVNGRRFMENGTSYITNAKGEAVETSNAASLRKDEWLAYDTKLVETAQSPLDFVNWCESAGLTETLPNALGTLEIMYETVSDTEGAVMAMDFAGQSQDSDVQYSEDYVPVPVMFADWELSRRRLEASRNGTGPALDTTIMVKKARNLREKIEDTALNASYKDGRGALYGLLTFPYNFTASSGTKWTDAGKTGKQIYTDVKALVKKMNDENYFGGFSLLISNDYAAKLDDDYSNDKGSNTIKERILKMAAIDEIVTIRDFPADKVVIMRKDKEAFHIKKGMPLTMWETSTNHDSRIKFRIGAIEFPMMKHDFNDKTPIYVHTYTA